jgi:predicted Zn-ribbon and HTH transcriptional regulator|tara:strand:+ start:500 stop:628 length:129 start_codon:yes stop_codon:yes gene_type:complete
MARIRTTTYTMEKNFCGRCGIILSKSLDIFDRCPKCKEVIEA